MIKVVTSFATSRYSDAELSIKASEVVNMMTNNPNFSDPEPALATVQSNSDVFSTALNNSKSGSHEAVALKNKARLQLEMSLHKLAQWVNLKAEGEQVKLITTGFDLTHHAEPIGPLNVPDWLKVKPGKQPGCIELECAIVHNARYYVFSYRLLTNKSGNTWTNTDSTNRKLLLAGLNSGGQYAFRAAGGGSDPSRNWCPEVTSYVL